MGVRSTGLLIGGVLLALAGGAPAGDLKYSNKWRLDIDEGANNDGVLRFQVTPNGETATEVVVNLKEGRSENGVATDVENAFKSTLDKERYHVEKDDGEDVLVKKKDGPDFSIVLLEDTVRGTNVDVERE